MTLTFYDGLGDTAYCNCCPLLPSLPPSFLPFTLTPLLSLAKLSLLFFFFLTLKSAPSFSMRRLVACRSDDH